MRNDSYRKRTEGVVTHTKLEDFAFCQELYRLRWVEWVESEGDEEESEALLVGSAYDAYLQSVKKFHDEYEIVARRTWKSSKTELTVAQGKLVWTMAMEMARQPFYNPVGEKQFNVRVKMTDRVTLSGTIDEFQSANSAIIDDKTSANASKFEAFREKYRRQLAFYQWLVWLSLWILCDGMVRMVTKEKIPKAMFFFAERESLKLQWERFAQLVSELDACVETGTWAKSPREKCLSCPAYAKCPNSKQQELYPL